MMNKYVFLMVPNNSGSHVLAHLLLSSNKVAPLPNLEGLFFNSFNYSKFSSYTPKDAFMFTSREEEFRSVPNYHWDYVKKIWDAEWNKFYDRPIKIEKSPPLICAHNNYPEVFENYKYIVMYRNPYAVAEGTRRSIMEKMGHEISAIEAITHAVRVLEICQEIIESHSENSIHFSYEDFTENTQDCVDQISNFITELSDIKIYERYDIKGIYKSKIYNMNDQQIKRISENDLSIMREYVENKKLVSDANSLIHLY